VVPPGTEAMVSHRLDARRRVEAQTRHLQVCRWLDRLVPLSVYYRHPKGGAYCRVVEGWQP
jgi:hypothetical protein